MEDQQRLIRLEEQLTYLQRDVNELNEVVRSLNDDLARTRKELRAVEHNLHQHLSDTSEDDAES